MKRHHHLIKTGSGSVCVHTSISDPEKVQKFIKGFPELLSRATFFQPSGEFGPGTTIDTIMKTTAGRS